MAYDVPGLSGWSVLLGPLVHIQHCCLIWQCAGSISVVNTDYVNSYIHVSMGKLCESRGRVAHGWMCPVMSGVMPATVMMSQQTLQRNIGKII